VGSSTHQSPRGLQGLLQGRCHFTSLNSLTVSSRMLQNIAECSLVAPVAALLQLDSEYRRMFTCGSCCSALAAGLRVPPYQRGGRSADLEPRCRSWLGSLPRDNTSSRTAHRLAQCLVRTWTRSDATSTASAVPTVSGAQVHTAPSQVRFVTDRCSIRRRLSQLTAVPEEGCHS
jgi:hypothetical protein